MKRLLFMLLAAGLFTAASAQPAARRRAQQQQQPASNADNVTERQKIAFPTMAPMAEDVVWRRDIYREIDLNDEANSPLYYPVEPVGTQMNLFTYIFKLMMTGQVPAFEYRLDGNEVYADTARIKPLAFLDNYHIYYERVNGRIRLDNSDIPSREVKAYYLKESAYYDQATSTFHRKVVALCPIMTRDDDFGDGSSKYPLFWVRYDDLAPFLSKQIIMTSDLNNAATMSVNDYFTLNRYKGKIYKTNNMLGRTLAQYCTTDTAMAREQKKIENELAAFEKNLFGDPAKKDSLDSIARAQENVKGKKVRKSRASRRTQTVKTRRSNNDSTPSMSSPARVTVRRQRH